MSQIICLLPVSLSPLRFSVRVNSTDVFHVDRRFWTSFRSRFPATGPRERAFHSATVIGNYMVVYGEGTYGRDADHREFWIEMETS